MSDLDLENYADSLWLGDVAEVTFSLEDVREFLELPEGASIEIIGDVCWSKDERADAHFIYQQKDKILKAIDDKLFELNF